VAVNALYSPGPYPATGGTIRISVAGRDEALVAARGLLGVFVRGNYHHRSQRALPAGDPAARSYSDYHQLENGGKPIEFMLPQRFRCRNPAHRDDFFCRAELPNDGRGMEIAGRRKDGTEFPPRLA